MNTYEYFAVSQFLSDIPAGKTYKQVLSMLYKNSPKIIIWEPFEDHGGSYVADCIESLKYQIEQQFTPKGGI